MDFDTAKFRALVLYVIWRAGDSRDLGATKLNKILWFSDARAYEIFGHSITGETYVREKFGPVPRHINQAIKQLSEDGLIQVWMEPYYDHEVTRFVAHAPPDTSSFTVEELGLVDWWVKHVVEHHTATSISEKSHDYGWKIAGQGEELPFKAFLAKRIRPPKEGEELEWATSAAKSM